VLPILDPRHPFRLDRRHEMLTPTEQIHELLDKGSYYNWLMRKAKAAFARQEGRVAEFWYVRAVQRCGHALGL